VRSTIHNLQEAGYLARVGRGRYCLTDTGKTDPGSAKKRDDRNHCLSPTRPLPIFVIQVCYLVGTNDEHV
jgi:hypothetical protein